MCQSMTKIKNRDEQFVAWKKCDLVEKIRHGLPKIDIDCVGVKNTNACHTQMVVTSIVIAYW